MKKRSRILLAIKKAFGQRRSRVKINKAYSDLNCIISGVPQGSVLGAFQFLIYVNELCSAKFNEKLNSFADDTALR